MKLVAGHFGDMRLRNPGGPWYVVWGRWWAVVFALNRTFSLGVHVDPRRQKRGVEPFRFGPCLDIHLPMLCISLGEWCVYEGALEAQRGYARGGLH